MERAMAERPQGTVTFFFTDIEGSTELVRRLGERYADLLGEHRRLLRAAFSEHGGWEIDTQGDAFFVAFDRVKDSILAAVAAQRSLAAHNWPSESVPKIRIGLHTTEPHLWPEGYVGVGVHRANRICAVGHGGQVLLSRSTAGIAADEEIEGTGLVDLGEHRLKGLEHPERIFQLVIDELENDFPPLDTIEGAGLATETVTVLFADLRGATRHMHDLPPEQFRRLLADYHRTLGRVLSDSGGMGAFSFADSAGAAYRSAREAVDAAANLQLRVSEHPWPSDVHMQVAVALDSGEVVATGHGPFGEVVNRDARLLDQTHGGQVLISEATRSLLEGEDLGQLELLQLEERPLAPGGRPLRVYQLIVPGLPADFPPWETRTRDQHRYWAREK
jgi:class 3 adenylate cyclase